jgi:hypothetical protein
LIIVGERINGTSRRIREAVMGRNAELIAELARRQAEAGADYLDVNAGTDPEREPEDMVAGADGAGGDGEAVLHRLAERESLRAVCRCIAARW